MEILFAKKDSLRKEIASLKNKYTQDELLMKSEEVMSVLAILGVFQEAKNIFIYNSLIGEVNTASFIEEWKHEKQFYLPIVVGEELFFRKYTSDTLMQKSAFGVEEPLGENFTDYKKIDLIVVPGVAFDRKMNRIGYGKGYYDKFLAGIKAPKVGVCFDFQLLDTVPTNENDVRLDYIVSENDLIW